MIERERERERRRERERERERDKKRKRERDGENDKDRDLRPNIWGSKSLRLQSEHQTYGSERLQLQHWNPNIWDTDIAHNLREAEAERTSETDRQRDRERG